MCFKTSKSLGKQRNGVKHGPSAKTGALNRAQTITQKSLNSRFMGCSDTCVTARAYKNCAARNARHREFTPLEKKFRTDEAIRRDPAH
jgi:hypothetical protein